MERSISNFFIKTLLALAVLPGCKKLDVLNENQPDREAVLSTGADLMEVLAGGYATWWQGVHGDHTAIAIGVTSDAYGMPWDEYGARRMGEEPRLAYHNRTSETPDYRLIAETPWYGCLSAASSANDVLAAMDKGVGIDQGGPQDQSIRAAAHMLRGLSRGYLGLIFDQSLIVDEKTDLESLPGFSDYTGVVAAAVADLETALDLSAPLGGNFIHNYFNGLILDGPQFARLCHAYAARFLAQWPRTATEYDQVDWQAVLDHAHAGLTTNFAPVAKGGKWTSYHKYTFAETGLGPLWARVDQRLVAAMDPSQPPRYPEVIAKGEAPLSQPMAASTDKRLAMDFIFLPQINFPASRGEWHFSHYKHNRNISDPGFAGDGQTSGPMPVFLAADCRLLEAEAHLGLGQLSQAIGLMNSGARSSRGNLPNLPAAAGAETIKKAIFYERAIELFNTAPMGMWFDRRRVGPRLDYLAADPLGGLQTGTPAQLPVPANELRVHGEPPYDFGGPQDPEGIIRVF